MMSRFPASQDLQLSNLQNGNSVLAAYWGRFADVPSTTFIFKRHIGEAFTRSNAINTQFTPSRANMGFISELPHQFAYVHYNDIHMTQASRTPILSEMAVHNIPAHLFQGGAAQRVGVSTDGTRGRGVIFALWGTFLDCTAQVRALTSQSSTLALTLANMGQPAGLGLNCSLMVIYRTKNPRYRNSFILTGNTNASWNSPGGSYFHNRWQLTASSGQNPFQENFYPTLGFRLPSHMFASSRSNRTELTSLFNTSRNPSQAANSLTFTFTSAGRVTEGFGDLYAPYPWLTTYSTSVPIGMSAVLSNQLSIMGPANIGNFTFCGWFRLNRALTSELQFFSSTNSGFYGWSIFTNSTRSLQFVAQGIVVIQIAGTNFLQIGEWFHLGFSRLDARNPSWQFFVNGILVNSFNSGWGAPIATPTAVLLFGNDVGAVQFADVRIDNGVADLRMIEDAYSGIS